MSAKSRRRFGFTLIELLVVVAIVALLMAILLPVLSKAREQGKSTKCLSTLKSIANASAAYTAEWDGYLFPNNWSAWSVPLVGSGSAMDMRKILAGYLAMPDWTNADSQRFNIWTCPSIAVDIKNTPTQQWPLTYGANCMPHPRLSGDPTVANPVKMLKLMVITRPAEVISISDTAQLTTGTSQGFIDGTNVTPPYGWWSAYSERDKPAYPPGATTVAQANVDFVTSRVRYRHGSNTKVNALFLDGHSESVPGPIYGRNLSTRY